MMMVFPEGHSEVMWWCHCTWKTRDGIPSEVCLGGSLLLCTRDPAGQSTPLCDFRFSWLTTVAVLRLWDFFCVRQRGAMWAAPFAFESCRPSEGLHGAEIALMAKGWPLGRGRAQEHQTKQTKLNGSSGSSCVSLCCVLPTSLWGIKVLKHCSNQEPPYCAIYSNVMSWRHLFRPVQLLPNLARISWETLNSDNPPTAPPSDSTVVTCTFFFFFF